MKFDKDEIIADLVDNAPYFELDGVEFTEEDADSVIGYIENDNMRYDDAIDVVLKGIRECLDDPFNY